MVATSTPLAGLHCAFHRMAAANTAPAAATAVGQLTAIGDLVVNREISEYHVYQDEWQRKLATTLSVEDIEMEGVFIGTDADQTALRAAMISGSAAHFAITYAVKGSYATGTIARFQAIVTNFARMSPIDDKVTFKISLAITGAVTEAAL